MKDAAPRRFRVLVVAAAITWAVVFVGFLSLLLAAYLSHHR